MGCFGAGPTRFRGAGKTPCLRVTVFLTQLRQEYIDLTVPSSFLRFAFLYASTPAPDFDFA